MTTNSPTVCILTAGIGSRMGPFASIINKSLLPIYDKGIISHIINCFPQNTNFVIALGYKGEQVKNYLELMHSEINFKFIKVDNFDGNGSGPAYSLMCCKSELQKPFFFVASDGFYKKIPLNFDFDWLGISESESHQKDYCNIGFETKTKIVSEVFDKLTPPKIKDLEFKPFNGLMFIKNFKLFWDALDLKNEKNEQQISLGFKKLIENRFLKIVNLAWMDLGSFDKYNKNLGLEFDFSKTNEFIYFSDKKIVKFFHDSSIALKRVQKARLNPKVFPQNIVYKDQFFSYDKVEGDIVYKNINLLAFQNLLKWLLKNLWISKKVNNKKFQQICEDFYIKKTHERVALFKNKYPNFKDTRKVNGVEVIPIDDLLKIIPKSISQGIPVFMHGDLHFDNMITKNNIQFSLIDWRQDFAGKIEYGDWYYDLAKLYGGIHMNYDYIKNGLMNYQENEDNIWLDYAIRKSFNELSTVLENFIISQGLDLNKVKLIQGIIYLNMSPLHHPPFDKLLFSLSQKILSEQLK